MAPLSEALVIFSRFDSSRLPGKALMDVAGRSLLGRCIDRARRVSGNPPIIVATSGRPVDDAIAHFAESQGVAVFRGDADDVAGRALACAERFGLVRFARICGDSPFLCPEIIGGLLEIHRTGLCDVACNVLTRSFPAGLSVEIIATEAMRQACREGDAEDHEHVTRFFYRNLERFRIFSLAAADPQDMRAVSLALDTPDDLIRLSRIAQSLGSTAAEASLTAILDLARSTPP